MVERSIVWRIADELAGQRWAEGVVLKGREIEVGDVGTGLRPAPMVR